MIVLVVLLGVVVALLAVLVVGLLRSHAEILRRLHELGAGVFDDDTDAGGVTSRVELSDPPARQPDIRTVEGVPEPRGQQTGAHDVAGVTPDGRARAIGVVGAPATTLLAFLSSGCGTCMDFWRAFGEGEADDLLRSVRLVVVTKGPHEESQSAVQALAPPGVTTLMSSEAYEDYGVPVSPYFILIDGPEGKVIGEGAAATWAQVAHLLQQAVADGGARLPGGPALSASASGGRRLNGAEREARADAELLSAGITPGHASLYPERVTSEPDDDEAE